MTTAPPRPRSPPKYPDFCGRRRLQLEVQILNREVGYLESGRMYYLNRKTLKKSWVRPREQKLNLELNISTFPSSQTTKAMTIAIDQSSYTDDDSENSSGSGGGGNMIAVACVNCHLLVMLMKSSPSCPNCKFMHSLLPPSTAAVAAPTRLQTPVRKMDAVKSLETLSLLH